MGVLRLFRSLIYLIIGVALVVIGVSVFLSPPTAGRERAQALRIPYRAIIAHRGASGYAPEGTMPAYLLAREMGADYLEADLQRTKDGVIVVFHDDTLARTTNVADVFPGRENDFIETFTYAELMRLDAGSWFNREFPERARSSYVGERILTLEQLLDVAGARSGGRPGLYLETKGSERHSGFERRIVQILRDKGWLPAAPGTSVEGRHLVFQSFNPDSLRELAVLAPEVPRVLLISTEIEAEHGWDNLLDVAEEVGHGVGPVGFLAWPWHTGEAHKRDLIVHPYVINEAWQVRLLTLFGVDGLFTDELKVAFRNMGRPKPLDYEALLTEMGY